MGTTLVEYIKGVDSSSISPQEVRDMYLDKAVSDTLNVYARVHNEYASTHAEAFFGLPLRGAPIAVKDNFLVAGTITSCGSAMMQDFVSPYTSTVIAKLEQAGGCMIGKVNMDEFAMGSSTETCAFGPVLHPLDPTRTPGGSSGGSAAAVAGDLCIAALGTDTAGSVRQPAAMCGVVGAKPTYGRVSRYGIQAMSSSLDQAGVITKTVEDAALLLDVISGKDDFDAMTVDRGEESSLWREASMQLDLTGKKIALPKEFLTEGLDDRILEKLNQTIELLRSSGAEVEVVDLPVVNYGVPAYYILCPAEVSTNLARFDGVRFGKQKNVEDFSSMDSYYAHVRQAGFGPEVMRRIMVGGYVLSAGFYDAYYRKAQLIRAKMKKDFSELFASYDAIIGPTSPVLPWKLGTFSDDPVKMYLADVYTVLANMVGIPALTVPMGMVEEEGSMLPTGFQIMTNHRDEYTMFQIGAVVEHGQK